MSPAPDSAGSRPLVGILCRIASSLCYLSMAACAKWLGDAVPIGQLMFARNAFGMIPLFIYMLATMGVAAGIRTNHPISHFGRTITGFMALSCYFLAVARMPLPDVTALNGVTPLVTSVLAIILLGERPSPRRLACITVGFTGAAIILVPHVQSGAAGLLGLGALFALGNTAFLSITLIQIRRMSATESSAAIVFWFTLFAMLMGLATAPFGWIVPDARQALLLLGVGVLGGIGQILQTLSLRYAPITVLAPFEYSNLVWSALIGGLFFAEYLGLNTLVGAGIIVAAAIAMGLDQRRPSNSRR